MVTFITYVAIGGTALCAVTFGISAILMLANAGIKLRDWHRNKGIK